MSSNLTNRHELKETDLGFGFREVKLVAKGRWDHQELAGTVFLGEPPYPLEKLTAGLLKLSKLTYLNLSYSAFSGEVPKEISHLSMVSSLSISCSIYTLTMNGSIFKSLIHNLTNIKQLVLSGINMSVVTIILKILANLSSSLTTLDLAHCGLYGEYFGQVFNLPKLQYLDLSSNYDLRGYLLEFHSSNTFTHLRLASTSIFGMLPASVGNLSQLIELYLSSSNLNGHIPSSIGNLSLLTTLDLLYNNLEGQIPSSFDQLMNLESLLLSGNRLSGMVDLNMFGKILELKGIQKGLTSLNLSNNFLTSHIPSSLGKLSKLEVLDLSHNKLSWQIPQQLALLNFLEIFNVPHNNFSRPIPHGKQFDTFLNSSYEGNTGFCGKPLSEECGDPKDSPSPSSSTVEEEEEKGSALEFGWKLVVIGYGCGLVIGIVVGHFVIKRRYDWFAYTFGIRLPKYKVK
nr:receptor-like protein Cf-9 homolog [Ziziphus jujuba var. spinosa]